jgi:hypothetical protein
MRACFSVRDSVDGYLPRLVSPVHYNLEVITDIYQSQPPFPFRGHVSVFVTCSVKTNVVILNTLNLQIIGADVFSDPDNPERPPSPVLLQVRKISNGISANEPQALQRVPLDSKKPSPCSGLPRRVR